MTLPASGSISFTDVLAELQSSGSSRALPLSLGDADVLALAGKTGLPISLADLYGKSAYNAGSVTSVTVPSGTYLSSDGSGDTNGAWVSFQFYSDGTWTLYAEPGLGRMDGYWTSEPAVGVGAHFTYTLTCTGSTTKSVSGVLANEGAGVDELFGVGAQLSAVGSATAVADLTTNVTFVITQIGNPSNTRTITFTMHAVGRKTTTA